MNWAENHIKLSNCKAQLKAKNQPGFVPTEEDLMQEYILQGGRIVHPQTGEVLDNNVGADLDERGQVTERHPEAYIKKIPEFVKAFKEPKKAVAAEPKAKK